MTIHWWASAYLPGVTKKQVVAVLRELYESSGYQPYDPFPGGTGTPPTLSRSVRLFVAPTHKGWVRIIGESEPEILQSLAEKLDISLVSVWIDEKDGRVEVFGGKKLSDFLNLTKTPEDLARAEKIHLVDAPSSVQGELADFASDLGVKNKPLEKLFQKTTHTIFKKLEADEQTQAQALAALSGQFSWNSAVAQRVQAVMTCLTIPDGWQTPDFKDLAAVYPIARLLEINEDAPLLPGDEDLLDSIEFPLDYAAVYFAK